MKKSSTAPKDGSVFLGLFKSLPNLTCAMWSGAVNQFAVAVPQIDCYHEEWVDCYFETEYFDENDLILWDKIDEIDHD